MVAVYPWQTVNESILRAYIFFEKIFPKNLEIFSAVL